MATLTVQQIERAGIVPSFAAAAGGGDEFPNDGKTYIEIVNAAVDVIVTVVSQKTVSGLAVADEVQTVTASTSQKLGPYPPNVFNDSSENVQITYDDTSNVTIGVFRTE